MSWWSNVCHWQQKQTVFTKMAITQIAVSLGMQIILHTTGETESVGIVLIWIDESNNCEYDISLQLTCIGLDGPLYLIIIALKPVGLNYVL